MSSTPARSTRRSLRRAAPPPNVHSSPYHPRTKHTSSVPERQTCICMLRRVEVDSDRDRTSPVSRHPGLPRLRSLRPAYRARRMRKRRRRSRAGDRPAAHASRRRCLPGHVRRGAAAAPPEPPPLGERTRAGHRAHRRDRARRAGGEHIDQGRCAPDRPGDGEHRREDRRRHRRRPGDYVRDDGDRRADSGHRGAGDARAHVPPPHRPAQPRHAARDRTGGHHAARGRGQGEDRGERGDRRLGDRDGSPGTRRGRRARSPGAGYS